MSDDLSVSVTQVGPSVCLCSATGSIDARTAPEIQEAALPVLQGGGKVALDLSGITYTSSAGLRMLLLLHRHAQASGGTIVLAGLRPEVAEVMEATGFLGSFTCAPTAEAAVELLV